MYSLLKLSFYLYHEARWVLVYWPGEDATCIIKEEAVVHPSAAELKKGIECKVKIKKTTYVGKIVEIGKNNSIMNLKRTTSM